MTKDIRGFLPRLGPKEPKLDTGSGWQRITSTELRDLVDPESSNGDSTPVAWGKEDSLPMRGVPTPWARKVLFESALLDEAHPRHKEAESQWRGLLALVAFHQLRGLRLKGDAVDLSNREQRLGKDDERFARRLLAHYPKSRIRGGGAPVEVGCVSILADKGSWIPIAATSERVLLFPGVRKIGKGETPEFVRSIHPFVDRIGKEFQDPLKDKEWADDQKLLLAGWVVQLLDWLNHGDRKVLLKGTDRDRLSKILERWGAELSVDRTNMSAERFDELLGSDASSALVRTFHGFPILPRTEDALTASLAQFRFRGGTLSSGRLISPSAPSANEGADVTVRLFRGDKPVNGTISLPGVGAGRVQDGVLSRTEWDAAERALAGSTVDEFLDLTSLFEKRLCRWRGFKKKGLIGPGVVFLKVGKDEALYPIKLQILEELGIGSAKLPDLVEAEEVNGAIEVTLKIPVGAQGSDYQIFATRRYRTSASGDKSGDKSKVVDLKEESNDQTPDLRNQIPELRMWPTLAGPSWRTYQFFARNLESGRGRGVEPLPLKGAIALTRHQSEVDGQPGRCWWRVDLSEGAAASDMILPFRYEFGSAAHDGTGLFFLDRRKACEDAPASRDAPGGWKMIKDSLTSAEVSVDLGSTHTALFYSKRLRKDISKGVEEPSSIHSVQILPLTGTLLGDTATTEEVESVFFSSNAGVDKNTPIRTMALIPGNDWADGELWTPGLGSMSPITSSLTRLTVGREPRVKLKWGQDKKGGSEAEKDDRALRVFLTHLLWQIKATMAAQGMSIGRLFWAYPGSMGHAHSKKHLNRLNRAWEQACSDAGLDRGPDSPPVLQVPPISEAEAITHYTQASAGRLEKGAVIIDVGGSTTDIAVVFDGRRSFDSLRLAGGFLSPLILKSTIPPTGLIAAVAKAMPSGAEEDKKPEHIFKRLCDMMLKARQVTDKFDLYKLVEERGTEVEMLAFPVAVAASLFRLSKERPAQGPGPGPWADFQSIAARLNDGVAPNVRGRSQWAQKTYLSPIHSALCLTAGAIAFYSGLKVREAFEAHEEDEQEDTRSFMDKLGSADYIQSYLGGDGDRNVLEIPVYLCGKGSLLFAWFECVAGKRKNTEYGAFEALMKAGFHLDDAPRSKLGGLPDLDDITFKVQDSPHEKRWKEEVGRGLLMYGRENSHTARIEEGGHSSPWGEEGVVRHGREDSDPDLLLGHSPFDFTVSAEDVEYITKRMSKDVDFRTQNFAVLRAFVEALENQVNAPLDANPWYGLSCGLGRKPRKTIEASDDFAACLEDSLRLLHEGESLFAIECRALIAALFGVRSLTSRDATL